MWADFSLLLIVLISLIVFFLVFKEEKISAPSPNLLEQIETLQARIKELKHFHSIEISKKEKEFKLKQKENEKKIRADAIARHKNSIKGKTTEHLIPYVEEFIYNPSDCRFMGSPIDIMVFNGLSEGKKDVDIVFVEIKTGKSSLSTRERKVRDAVKNGRISWRLVRKP